ncbi:MAG: cell division protein CrgA [Leucobacter sp.]
MAAAGKNVSKRKSAELTRDRAAAASARKDAPNPVWFKPVMFGFMLLGLVWIVLYYITSASTLPLPVPALGQANIFVGFGLVLVGFLMTPWWK